ncbi:4'-phosphopantetheinyl transferase superfamily protein [Vibrio vulnificus]|uniref:4'-phosphopantetheinyl transferase family protein n=1 Tax=Marinagarivorans algicola TaxID=1513270 RepID=UPI0009E9C335|nr:4'-phosphopantetheinyl transferase superfamily protein [Marinagarivorans algicola]EGQ9933734.1 4'-phosphopantetheinyl transferase superfamily protein [Vibrio vulnificus]
MLSCPWRIERLPVCERYGAICLMMRTNDKGFDYIRQEHKDILFPKNIDNAVRSRQIEFFAGRLLAKRALEELGSFHTDVSIGIHREPLWPSGFVGSITHSKNIIGVLVLRNNNLLVGMDIEHQIASEQSESLSNILSNKELTLLAQNGLSKVESFTIGFSAKETLFKAVFPRVKRYLDFDQSTLFKFDSNRCCIDIELHIDRVSRRYKVLFVDLGIFLITSLIEPADW